MATVNSHEDIHETRFDEDKYPVWKNAFDAQTRHHLMDEDMHAGRNVGGILFILIGIGIVLGLVGVILAMNY